MALFTAPAGRSSVVAGAYRSTWNGLDLGLVSVDGHQLRIRTTAIPITADITGETIVDMIHTGVLPTMTMTLQNWNAQAIESLIWWHGTGRGLGAYKWGSSDGVGLKMFDFAKPLVLTACHSSAGAATPSNPTIDPISMTFYKTILAPDQDIEVLLSHRPRFLTVTLQILPVTIVTTTVEGSPVTTYTRASGCDQTDFWTCVRNVAAPLVDLGA